MKIYLGADHRGFLLKEQLLSYLETKGEVYDLGSTESTPDDDYVDYAKEVAKHIGGDNSSRGILFCGSGIGMAITANKIAGVRAAVGHTSNEIKEGRTDDDINVLALAGDFLTESQARELVDVFLETEFIPEMRFTRRIAKIKELETHA